MITPADLLDMVRVKRGLNSDYAIGKMLGWSGMVLRNFRVGRNFPDVTRQARLAGAVGVTPEFVAVCIAECKAKQAGDPAAVAIWRQSRERLAKLPENAVPRLLSRPRVTAVRTTRIPLAKNAQIAA